MKCLPPPRAQRTISPWLAPHSNFTTKGDVWVWVGVWHGIGASVRALSFPLARRNLKYLPTTLWRLVKKLIRLLWAPREKQGKWKLGLLVYKQQQATDIISITMRMRQKIANELENNLKYFQQTPHEWETHYIFLQIDLCALELYEENRLGDFSSVDGLLAQ